MIDVRKKLVDGRDVSPECRNCVFSRPLDEKGFVLCEKTGIRNVTSLCRKYKYDPLSRVPQRTPDIMDFSEDDFSL